MSDLEGRVRQNEKDIVEIKTDMKHLPAQMKSAVQEGLAAHADENPPEASFWDGISLKMKVTLVSVALTFGYSMVKLIDALTEMIKAQ